MSDSSAPHQVSPGATASEPVVILLSEVGNDAKRWTITLHPTHLALAEDPDPQPYIILREEVMRSANLMEGLKLLVIEKPRKLNLKLTPEGTKALAEWIGNGTLAGFYLRRRYAWMFPIACLVIVGSLPIAGNPERGVAGMPFDVLSFALGATLMIAWAFAKWRPHPILFLVDSIWLVTMAGRLVFDVVQGRSMGWLVAVALFLWLAISGTKHFLRFRGSTVVRWK